MPWSESELLKDRDPNVGWPQLLKAIGVGIKNFLAADGRYLPNSGIEPAPMYFPDEDIASSATRGVDSGIPGSRK